MIPGKLLRQAASRNSGFKAGALGPLLALVLTVGWPCASAQAAPQMPCQFYGEVIVGGQSAPPGLEVTAFLNGDLVTSAVTDSLGRYGFAPSFFRIPADDPDTEAQEGAIDGDSIQLCVDGSPVAAPVFASGGIVNVNLSVADGGTPAPRTVPSAPVGLSAQAKDYNQIVLIWADSSDTEGGFHIARSLNGSGYDVIATTAPNEITYSDTSVEVGVLYYYLVTAFNDAGESSFAGPATASAIAPPSPAPPAQVPAQPAPGPIQVISSNPTQAPAPAEITPSQPAPSSAAASEVTTSQPQRVPAPATTAATPPSTAESAMAADSNTPSTGDIRVLGVSIAKTSIAMIGGVIALTLVLSLLAFSIGRRGR